MKTILLGLNELNFHFVEKYIKKGYLPHFKKLFEQYGYTETQSENEYHLLEPWIQWVTIHTGKTYAEHQVFRLGDIVKRADLDQLFEIIENKGYRVGAVSPFNADNRLKKPAFYAADPWTKTSSSGNFILKNLAKAISQVVNDNAQARITLSSFISLVLGLAYYTPIKDYSWYMQEAFKIKNSVSSRSLILDKLLSDVFLKEWKKTQPDFSLLFLNSGAHLQHHYMFNSKVYEGPFSNPEWYCPHSQDPIYEIYSLYDRIIGNILQFSGVRLILATGLSQQPHDTLTFYWRLKNHASFLSKIGITHFSAIHPRMSRDFLVEFHTKELAMQAEEKLKACHLSDGALLFSIDNRGNSLFIELIYSGDISTDMVAISGDVRIPSFKEEVAFVALKNGEHNSVGYYLDTLQPTRLSSIALAEINTLILKEYT